VLVAAFGLRMANHERSLPLIQWLAHLRDRWGRAAA
jgi:hypothetical protein